MTTRNRLSGLGASLLIVFFVIGTPLLLISIGAKPWTENAGDLGTLLTSPDDGTLAMLVISAIAWVAWAILAVSFVAEIVAAVRGASVPRLPGLSMPQDFTRRIVTVAALLFAAAPTVTPVFAPLAAHAAPVAEAPRVVALPEIAPVSAPAVVSVSEESQPTVEYTVRRGDSLWKIAEERLGDPMRFREIVALNEAVLHGEPDFIDPGLVLRLPSVADEVEPDRKDDEYVVETGDTLWDIADEELGDGARYPEIFEASKDTVQPGGQHLSDPDLILTGWKLTIPGEVDNPPADDPPVVDPPTVVEPHEHGTGGKHLDPNREEPTHPAETPSVAPPVSESDEHAASVSAESADESSSGWLLPGLAGAGALLAGAVLVAVRAHQRTQQRYRRPGLAVASPPATLREVEKSATVAGAPTADALDQLDRLFRHLVGEMDALPTLAAVEVAKETVTLHLAEPLDLPSPWTGENVEWTTNLNTDVGDADELPPYPLLTSVGISDDGHLWLLDLEHFGSTAITGDVERATALLRHVAAELALSPWSVISQVDALGVAEELASLDDGRLRCHSADETEFLAMIQRDLEWSQKAGHGDPEPFHALLVSGVRSDGLEALINLVEDQTSRSGLAVVRIDDPGPHDSVVEVAADGLLRVPGVDVGLRAAGLTSEEAAATAAIVDLTRESPIVPMPRREGESGWRALADEAGALIPELTEPRALGPVGDHSLLPEATQRYESVATTTPEDVETLAPIVPPQTRSKVEETDPDLDDDLAAWLDPDCGLPKLQVLGPVTVTAADQAPAPIPERIAYFTEMVAFMALHPNGVSSRMVGDAFGIVQGRARTDLCKIREWFGESSRTGELHLPPAPTSRAHGARGTGGYQLSDVLVDLDLFKRLRIRAQARGAAGMDDLVAALRLVGGEPFSALRNPGWAWMLDGERVHETAALAVVDVAHIVATDALSRGDLERAHFAAETGCTAAPYDEVCRLDLAKVAESEGHGALADQILNDQVFNRTDDYLPPIDPPERTKSLAKNHGWGDPRRPRKA